MSNSNLNDQIQSMVEQLDGLDDNCNHTYANLKPQLPLYFAAMTMILDHAHQLISLYARSLGKPQYYDIGRDEWKIGSDWNLTGSDGIYFHARVNEGNRYETCYREYEVTLPWNVLQDYIKDPTHIEVKLVGEYQDAVYKAQQAEVKKAADLKVQHEAALVEAERKLYETLKAKFGE